jgi:hypothetical protein
MNTEKTKGDLILINLIQKKGILKENGLYKNIILDFLADINFLRQTYVCLKLNEKNLNKNSDQLLNHLDIR